MYYCVGFTQVFKYDCIIFRRRPLKFFWSYTKICIKEIAMMWPCQAPSKTKTDLFCSWYGYWPHYNAENDHWKRSHSKTLSRVEQFKNDAFWKGWFLVEKTMLSENDDVINNRHNRTPDHSTVGIRQNGGQALPYGFSPDRCCGVDGWKRYENDKCGRKSFWKRSKTIPFSFENGLVWTGP